MDDHPPMSWYLIILDPTFESSWWNNPMKLLYTILYIYNYIMVKSCSIHLLTMAQWHNGTGGDKKQPENHRRIQLQAVTSKESVQWKSLALTGRGRWFGWLGTPTNLEFLYQNVDFLWPFMRIEPKKKGILDIWACLKIGYIPRFLCIPKNDDQPLEFSGTRARKTNLGRPTGWVGE